MDQPVAPATVSTLGIRLSEEKSHGERTFRTCSQVANSVGCSSGAIGGRLLPQCFRACHYLFPRCVPLASHERATGVAYQSANLCASTPVIRTQCGYLRRSCPGDCSSRTYSGCALSYRHCWEAGSMCRGEPSVARAAHCVRAALAFLGRNWRIATPPHLQDDAACGRKLAVWTLFRAGSLVGA